MEEDAQKIVEEIRAADDWQQRRAAIIHLGYCKGPYEAQSAAIEELLTQLRDPMPEIQQAAILSLGRLGAIEAIEELSMPRIMESPDMRVRWAAVSVLGALGDYRIIDTLLPVVEDCEWLVRNEAYTVIKEKVSEIVELGDTRLGRILLRMLSLDDKEIVELARIGLSQMGASCKILAIEALSNQNEKVRSNAVRVLAGIKEQEIFPHIIEALSDPSRVVRSSAARALSESGNPAAIEALVSALADSSELVQEEATAALLAFKTLATQPLLNALEHEKNKHTIRAIILTLGKIADQKSLPRLVLYLRSSYAMVRHATINALRGFGESIVPHLLEMLTVNESDIEALVINASDSTNRATQLRAINALGSLEDHRATWLLKLLEIGDISEVSLAAQAALVQIGCAAWGRCGSLTLLGEIGDENVLAYVKKALSDDCSNVRLEAIRALGKIGGRKVIGPLADTALRDGDAYLRTESLRTLRWLGIAARRVIDAGLTSLTDPVWEVRNQAARLLGNFQDNRSIAPLVEMLSDDNWSVRQSAEEALINFGKKAVPALIEALSSKDWVVRLRSARALGEIGDVRAIDPIKSAVAREKKHPAARRIEQQALLKISQAI